MDENLRLLMLPLKRIITLLGRRGGAALRVIMLFRVVLVVLLNVQRSIRLLMISV